MGDIFLKILNMSITAGGLILAVICFRFLFSKTSKWIHCLLWGVVAIRLLCPFSLESTFGLLPDTEPVKIGTAVGGKTQTYIPQIDRNWSVIENTVNPMLEESFAYEESESVAPLQVTIYAAGILWILGTALLLIGAVIGLVRLRLRVREAIPYRDNIKICDAVKSPFILGLFKPQIYLSSWLNDAESDYIVAHEQAHLKRKDHLWKLFGYLLLCVYWFNPLCWLAYLLFCKDMELACDERVIKDMDLQDRKEYSGTLLACANQRRPVMTCPLAFGEVGVKERVKTVLHYKKPAFWIVLLSLAVCLVVAVCFFTTSPKVYRIKITVPAESTEYFVYSEEEISPKGNTLEIWAGEGLGDTEVVLEPKEVTEENIYEPTYLTPGMPVKMDVEKGAWFRLGVAVRNSSKEDIAVYVEVKNIEVRIADYVENAVTTDKEPVEKEAEPWKIIDRVSGNQAYAWNNTAEFKPDSDILIKMASDTTGAYEIYGVISKELGNYGLVLNNIIDGEPNYNYSYESWVYTGSPEDEPRLEWSEDGSTLTFSFISEMREEEKVWKSYEIDCGYETGHMEFVISKAMSEPPKLMLMDDNLVSDINAIERIIVTNGNTGEALTFAKSSSEDVFEELLNRYQKLDFGADYEENTRVGYRYFMKLLDKDGNMIQQVTPYKDGFAIGRKFYIYKGSKGLDEPSVELMNYMDLLFYPAT